MLDEHKFSGKETLHIERAFYINTNNQKCKQVTLPENFVII
jgi:hypothetical protein